MSLGEAFGLGRWAMGVSTTGDPIVARLDASRPRGRPLAPSIPGLTRRGEISVQGSPFVAPRDRLEARREPSQGWSFIVEVYGFRADSTLGTP